METLISLGRQLRRDDYHFITPTPSSHAQVLSRATFSHDPLRDIFGWNRKFALDQLPADYHVFLHNSALFQHSGTGFRARVRFSTLGPMLLAHSSFPTNEQNAVFFGPDTYRFARALYNLKAREPRFLPRRVFDIGAGSGAGGLICRSIFPSLEEIILLDINPKAIELARANACLNDVVGVEALVSDVLQVVDGSADLIISNPPYLLDDAERAYRHGGGAWGGGLALRVLEQGLARLTADGHFLLYTGTPIVDGHDTFLEAAKPVLVRMASSYQYEETDPDVFGEELSRPPYNLADRIATVVLNVTGSHLREKSNA